MGIVSKTKDTLGDLRGSDPKSKVLARNIILAFVVKGLAVLVAFVNIPMFMHYFDDNSVLGVWFTLLSMLSWILMFDLGIGNGLRNHLVVALEEKNNEECRRLIASAYCSIATLVILLSIAAFVLVPRADWNAICNLDANLISPKALTGIVQMLIIGLLIQFFLKLITSILYAMQQSAVPNFLLLISNVLLLLSTLILDVGNPQDNLIRISIAYVITANLPFLVATMYVFLKPLRTVGLHLSYWSKTETKMVLGLGMSFLVLQLLSMATFNTREFYIMSFLGPDDVVPYQIYNRLFSLISTFFVLAMTPMWSAITQAAAQEDGNWIRKLYSKFIKVLVSFSISGVVIVLVSQPLIDIWLQDRSIQMDYSYGLLFAIYNVEYMWISLHSQFENGLNRLGAQKWGYAVSSVVLPLLSFLLAGASGCWVAVVVASIISLVPLCILQKLNTWRYLKEF